ncbi:hypothetical protein [Bordetella genomosp. 9]|uniref:hypothetical protein n=1 Tax=Bordetella genomosp. 9 TaxID=1416803 RepID=UPI0012FB7101|nr:hypothetical protein [Bordetella genomosp. 9]
MLVNNVNSGRVVDTYPNAISQSLPVYGSPAEKAFSEYQSGSAAQIGKGRAKRDTLWQEIELKDVPESGALRDSNRDRLNELGNEIKKDPNKFTKIEMDGCYKRVKEGAKKSVANAEEYLEGYLRGAGIEKDIETGEKRCGRSRDDFRNKHKVEVRVYTA